MHENESARYPVYKRKYRRCDGYSTL